MCSTKRSNNGGIEGLDNSKDTRYPWQPCERTSRRCSNHDPQSDVRLNIFSWLVTRLVERKQWSNLHWRTRLHSNGNFPARSCSSNSFNSHVVRLLRLASSPTCCLSYRAQKLWLPALYFVLQQQNLGYRRFEALLLLWPLTCCPS